VIFKGVDTITGPHTGHAPREALATKLLANYPVQFAQAMLKGDVPKRVKTLADLNAFLGDSPPARLDRPALGESSEQLYEDTCRLLTFAIERYAKDDPEWHRLPPLTLAMGDYRQPLARSLNLFHAAIIAPSQRDPDDQPLKMLNEVGVTARQWEWSVNAARRLHDLPAVRVEGSVPEQIIDITALAGYPDRARADRLLAVYMLEGGEA